MKIQVEIEVKDILEGQLIARGLADPDTRAYVIMTGALLPMPRHDRLRTIRRAYARLQTPAFERDD